MKKILSIILGVFLCSQVFAQVNVHAGYVNTSYHVSGPGVLGSLPGNGVFVGAGYDIKSSNYPNISISPEVNFNYVDLHQWADEGKDIFLNVPIHIKYVMPMSNIMDPYFSLGPNLVVPLDGGSFDAGFGVSVGALFESNVKLVFGYDFGLINQSYETNYKLTRNILRLGMGYIF